MSVYNKLAFRGKKKEGCKSAFKQEAESDSLSGTETLCSQSDGDNGDLKITVCT